MSHIIIPKGWRTKIYDVAKNIIVVCSVCGNHINLKMPGSFGVYREPTFDDENVEFLCKSCFSKLQKSLDDLKRDNREV